MALKLSTKWQFVDVRVSCISHLEELDLPPARRLQLAQEHDLQKWKLPAILELVYREKSISDDDDEVKQVGLEMMQDIMRYRDMRYDDLVRAVKSREGRSCDHDAEKIRLQTEGTILQDACRRFGSQRGYAESECDELELLRELEHNVNRSAERARLDKERLEQYERRARFAIEARKRQKAEEEAAEQERASAELKRKAKEDAMREEQSRRDLEAEVEKQRAALQQKEAELKDARRMAGEEVTDEYPESESADSQDEECCVSKPICT